VILVRDKQYSLGKELLTLSLKDEIDREHVHRSLGHIALIENDILKTQQEYELELKKFPDTDLQLSLGKLYSKTTNWEKAKEHFCIVSEERPKDTRSHLDCAQSWFNLEQYEKADEVLGKATALRPMGPYILLLEANIEAKIGDKNKAAIIFAKAKAEMEKQTQKRPSKP
jgi:tetratricopeptide (TPR) repeat protein